MPNSNSNKKKEKTKFGFAVKRIHIIAFLLILLILLAVAMNYDTIVRWVRAPEDLSLVLSTPLDGTEVNYVPVFHWNSTGGGDGLSHSYVWYLDISQNFNTPLLTTVSTADNFTTQAISDGYWYWKVEATDGFQTNMSETRSLRIRTNATNNMSTLTNGTVYPTTGYLDTFFTFNVTYTDADNDAPTYVRVYIDNTTLINMNIPIANPPPHDYTSGVIYQYTTLLPAGSHYFYFICSDGIGINQSEMYYGPTVANSLSPVDEPLIIIIPGDDDDDDDDEDTDEKMNKITLVVDDKERYPGSSFTGSLTITEESYDQTYEIFWYISLVNESGNEIAYDSGALAIHTTSEVAFQIPIPEGVLSGYYKIIAKTYDTPRESSHYILGSDSVNVRIFGQDTISGTMLMLVGSVPLLLILLLIAAVCFYYAHKLKKKMDYLITPGFISLYLFIILSGSVAFPLYPMLSVFFIGFGSFLLTDFQAKHFIKDKSLARLIGIVVIVMTVFLTGL